MKRIALVAALFAVAACSKGENSPANDTTTPTLAPAPADTSTRSLDSARVADSTRRADSIRAAGIKAKTP